MMNLTPFLIDSFNPTKSQTIYSSKRKATLIMNLLKKIDGNPRFLSIASPEATIPDIYSIFSPYHLRTHWIEVFDMYRHQKNLSWEQPISRGLLLDILAYSDGYPGWENMQHHLSHSTNNFKTFVLKDDPTLYEALEGGCSVKIFCDIKNQKNNGLYLYNPAEEFGQLEIGYSWGYGGSSVRELSRALLYSIDPNMVNYSDILAEGLLTYFAKNQSEMLLTELEIRQFMEHFKQNKDVPLRADPRDNKRNFTLSDLDFSNMKPYSLNKDEIISGLGGYST